MLNLDGTETKSKLGANAILAVSLANAKAAAASLNQPLFRYLGGPNAKVLPVPMANVINGGAHSDAPIDFQEFMIMPLGPAHFQRGLRAITEIFHALKAVLEEKRLHTAVGDEGGFAPKLGSVEEAIEAIIASHQGCRLQAGQGHLSSRSIRRRPSFMTATAKYTFKKSTGKTVTGDDLVTFYAKLAGKYPIVSIEDGCAESDWATWKKLTDKFGDKIQLVGDDLFVTNVKFLQKGIDTGTANSILVKVNQIGSLTETLDAVAARAVSTVTPPCSRIVPAKPRTRPLRTLPWRPTAARSRPEPEPHGSAGQIQPAAAHRAIARQKRRLCRHQRAAEGTVNR